MQLDALSQPLVERLLGLEQRAAHLHVLACVAEATAFLARQDADAAQRVLSEIKVWLALLPEDAAFQLLAPKPDDDDPAKRLGVRLLEKVSRAGTSFLPPPDREKKPMRHPLRRLPMLRRRRSSISSEHSI